MAHSIHDCLIKVEKRAERAGDSKLTETFVDAAPLLSSVQTKDHQIIFGRRGTGKTHILKYVKDLVQHHGNIGIYLDLRAIGSNGSIYSDQNKTHAQRATPLLLDVLGAMHEALLTISIDLAEELDLSKLGPKLDSLADAISAVAVVGTVEVLRENSTTSADKNGAEIGLSGRSLNLKASVTAEQSETLKNYEKRSGAENYYVQFGAVQSALRELISVLGEKHVWLFLDEWSEVPLDLQPYLADLLRRCVLPLPGITVKIAAIEHRSNLIIRRTGEYMGIELGADAGGDVNLDDFMVFDNDAQRAMNFFAALLYKHYRATDDLPLQEGPQSPSELISHLFTQITAFEEFVRAVEGVPRDAVYLASAVAQRAYGRLVSVQDVRNAARDWYQRDKATILKPHPELGDLLHWIIEEVIAHRRARAFLLAANQRYPLIDTLFDSRLLHVRKRNISSHDNPGRRYDVYKLDYGCYVDLIATSRAPVGLFEVELENGAGYVDVPSDDYRSIRRAILEITTFESRKEQGSAVRQSNGASGRESA
ncbi:ORC-CDC6 family AAA ATPase [Roseicella aquatilis]|uniref:Uncharacterized protein n=1 Tax=Roseicella aquatilis TaxID=2527868 RepID=A0A4R4DAS3_9PROT|nr:hypothetical protein [Roseicella aquatilis]TCZ56303.1 hypothetical protein EXY23_20190 [Roseicella aquatilis]